MHGIKDGHFEEHQKCFDVVWEKPDGKLRFVSVLYHKQPGLWIDYYVRPFVFMDGEPEPFVSFDLEESLAGRFYGVQTSTRHMNLGPAPVPTTAEHYHTRFEQWRTSMLPSLLSK